MTDDDDDSSTSTGHETPNPALGDLDDLDDLDDLKSVGPAGVTIDPKLLEWLRDFENETAIILDVQPIDETKKTESKFPNVIIVLKKCTSIDSDVGKESYIAKVFSSIGNHVIFDNGIMALVVLNAVLTGVSFSFDGPPPSYITQIVSYTGLGTNIVFSIEILIKSLSSWPQPWKFFSGTDAPVNTFDFMTVVLAYIYVEWGLLRLLRLMKLIGKMPSFRVIFMGLISGMSSVWNIFVLLFLVVYIYAIFGMIEFGKNDPFHFGSVMVSCLTLFRVATLSNFTPVYRINYFGCDKYSAGIYVLDESDIPKKTFFSTKYGSFAEANCYDPAEAPITASFYFFTFTFFTSMIILSLFVSIITVTMFDAITEIKEKNAKERRIRSKQAMASLMDNEDSNIVEKLHLAFQANEGETVKRTTCRRPFQILVQSKIFENTVTFFICVVGIVAGMTADGLSPSEKGVVKFVELAGLIFFNVEFILKLIAFQNIYFKDPWNCFDFCIVIISDVALVTNLGTFTPLRLLRILKILRTVPSIRSVVETIFASMYSVGSVLIVFIIFNYVMAILGMTYFRSNDKERFGNIPRAFMTVWMAETLDDWDLAMYIAMYGCNNYGYSMTASVDMHREFYDESCYSNYFKLSNVEECPLNTTVWVTFDTAPEACDEPEALGWPAAVYFVILVIFGGLLLPSLVIGTISITYQETHMKMGRKKKSKLVEEKIDMKKKIWEDELNRTILSPTQKNNLRDIFYLLDAGDRGGLLHCELNPLVTYVMDEFFNGQVDQRLIDEMFQIMDVDNNHEVDWCEFLWFVCNIKYKFSISSTRKPSSSRSSTVDRLNLGQIRHTTRTQRSMRIKKIEEDISALQMERARIVLTPEPEELEEYNDVSTYFCRDTGVLEEAEDKAANSSIEKASEYDSDDSGRNSGSLDESDSASE